MMSFCVQPDHILSTLKRTMADTSRLILILTLSCYFFSNPCSSETDTLQQGQQLKDWDYLISSNRVFSLKFFGFGSSVSPYLGIFYNDDHHDNGNLRYSYNDNYNLRYLKDYNYNLRYLHNDQRKGNLKAVWVANRDNPIPDVYGKLMIDVHGKLSILSSGGTVVDLFSPTPVTRNASAKLLDSGNFILRELNPDGSVKRVLWESFDYPTDTLLPGMRLGINHKTGRRWSLTSWRSEQLPASGSFILTGDPNGTDQMVILWRGSIQWMSGPWRNGQFENTDLQSSGPDVRLYYISDETEQSFMYLTKTYDSFPALTMEQYGLLKGSALKLQVECPSTYPGCAENDTEKFKCKNDYYFGGVAGIDHTYNYIYAGEYEYDESYNLTLDDCKRICWRNCSCMAYTYATKNNEGCKTYGQRIFNPDDAYEHRNTEYYPIRHRGPLGEEKGKEKKKKWIGLIFKIGLIVMIGSLALLLSCYLGYLAYKKLDVRGRAKKFLKLLLHRLRRFYNNIHQLRHFYNIIRTINKMNTELHYFTFQSILSATNNFSITNKLGEGGFGAVYKGKLVDGQEVAVKRLSRSSGQGVIEFKNEIELIAKLQHTNLVRLLGCCIEKEEKILVYEYMPNHSLDFFLFDPTKKGLLDWNNRFVIIDGIAQGLVYLHKFSRLRVIHRDLKASNILLDDYLKPKISDFGMAKLFGLNESEANTSRVVGTRGYMPPEYMMGGTISTKTDIFSFGVLLLEIVSGKMNHGSFDMEHPLNLLGLAWELWNEGKGLELMDPLLEDSCIPKEVMTCIHVGLLCVQDYPTQRPTMSEVISMLTNANMHLPEPKQPAFFIERHEPGTARDENLGNGSVNGQSFSILVAR